MEMGWWSVLSLKGEPSLSQAAEKLPCLSIMILGAIKQHETNRIVCNETAPKLRSLYCEGCMFLRVASLDSCSTGRASF